MLTLRLKTLRLLAQQKYATLEDLYIGSGSAGNTESFRVSLYQFGLGRFSFPAVAGGVWHIAKPQIYQELEQFFPQEVFYKSTDIHVNEVLHALDMNKIRHVLTHDEKANIQEWRSEYYLRALPPSARGFSYTKIPDAVFLRKRADGSNQKCFVEYERSLKSRERYRNILKSYVRREDVTKASVLFVCHTQHIKNELLRIRKEVLSKGVLNEQEEIFQFIDYETLLTRMKEVNDGTISEWDIYLVGFDL